MELAAAEIELVELQDRTMQLRQALVSIRDEYDYIMIDCPPSMGLTTLNAFSACDSVIIPIQCEYYALEGLSQLMSTIKQVKRLYNPVIELEGILLTMYDRRLKLTEQVEEEVKTHFPDKVYKTIIPRNVRLSEAPSMHARLIDPDNAGEDPFTGSAAGCMASYMHAHGLCSGTRIRLEQGHILDRPGTGELELILASDSGKLDAVRLGGTAVSSASGTLRW